MIKSNLKNIHFKYKNNDVQIKNTYLYSNTSNNKFLIHWHSMIVHMQGGGMSRSDGYGD